MSFNFIADDEDEVPQVELERAVGLQPEQAPEVEAMMSEAEQRFAKAQCFRSLIVDHLFTEDFSPTAMEVAAEVQAFCRERLAVLLGLKPEAGQRTSTVQAKPQFSDEQAKVLSQVANRLLKKPTLLEEAPQPTVRKAIPPKPPATTVPGPGRSERLEMEKKAAAAKAKPGPKPGKRSGNATGDVLSIPQKDGTKRSYRKMVDPQLGEYWMGENGQHYELATNDAGENYMKSLNRQARPQGGQQPLPPLTGDMMAIVAARTVQAAMDQDHVASGRASGGRAVVVAKNTPE